MSDAPVVPGASRCPCCVHRLAAGPARRVGRLGFAGGNYRAILEWCWRVGAPRYGDVVHLRRGQLHQVVISDPASLHEVLVKTAPRR